MPLRDKSDIFPVSGSGFRQDELQRAGSGLALRGGFREKVFFSFLSCFAP